MEGKFELSLMPHQAQWLNCPAQEMFVGGSAGPGKSHFLRAAGIHWGLLIPGLQVVLFRRKFGDLQKNHFQGPNSFYAMLAYLLQPEVGLAKITGSAPPIIQFRNGYYGDWETGTKITCSHLQHEKDLSSHHGPEYHLALFDELTHFTEAMYRFIRSRLRMPGLEIPDEYKDQFPKIIGASNPGGIGHTWVKETFITGAEPGEIRQMDDDEGGMTRVFMPALMGQNRFLDRKRYRSQLRGLGNSILVRAMEKGDWDIAPGAIFADVWDKDVHVLEPFIIPSSWHIDRTFDWGWSAPFSVGWWAQSDGSPAFTRDGKELVFARGSLFRIAEWYGWKHPSWPANKKPRANVGVKMDAVEIARGIKARERSMGLKYVSPGAAGVDIFVNENNYCIADDMEEEGIAWTKANATPGSRKAGLLLMIRMMKNSTEAFHEAPEFYVWKNCTNFIRTIPVLPSLEGDPDDVDTAAEDHIYDESRYRVLDTGFDYEQVSLGGY